MAKSWSQTLVQCWEGCVLSSLAHAVAVSRFPDLASDQSWDADNYCVQDGQGSRGAVAFLRDSRGQLLRCVGGVSSIRADGHRTAAAHEGIYNQQFAQVGINSNLLQSMLSHLVEDVGGKSLPCLTAGFWSMGSHLESGDEWSVFLRNGGHLLERQMQPTEVGIQIWAENYSMRNIYPKTTSNAVVTLRKIVMLNAEVLRKQVKQWFNDPILICSGAAASDHPLIPEEWKNLLGLRGKLLTEALLDLWRCVERKMPEVMKFFSIGVTEVNVVIDGDEVALLYTCIDEEARTAHYIGWLPCQRVPENWL